MTTFDNAFTLLLEEEGGYSNDTRDTGGATKYGISQKSYPTLDIENLTIDEAKQIYLDDYWNPLQCDKLNPLVATVLFLEAVNGGKFAIVKLLQESVGVTVDGIIGDQTVAATNAHNPMDVCEHFNALSAMRYATLNNYAIYGKGWMTRLFKVYRKALTNGNTQNA